MDKVENQNNKILFKKLVKIAIDTGNILIMDICVES